MDVQELKSRIDNAKKLLETLPVNTIANRKKRTDFIALEISDMKKIQNEVVSEMKNRFLSLEAIKENEELKSLKDQEEKLAQIRKLSNYNTPYERMHLDYYLYQLHRYYKEDLNSVNSCINLLLQTFVNVGITLSARDFYYHPLAEVYMEAILSKGDDSKYIHEVFESVYWKCPDIIKIIERNFKSLYYKNLKKIESFYEDGKKSLLEKHDEDEIKSVYLNTVSQRKALESVDLHTIMKRMLNRDFSVGDIAIENVEKKRKQIFNENAKEQPLILEKLSNSIIEYKCFMKYQYIIIDMKKRIEDKSQYKGKLEVKLKEIEKVEKDLFKFNANKIKAEKPGLFGKKNVKKDEKMAFQISEVLKKIEELYNELDDIKFNEMIFQYLSTDTFISEALKLVSSNYLYFVKLAKEVDDNRSIKDITNEYNIFSDFMNSFSFTFLNHIHLLEEKNIAEIISDHYKMYNVILEVNDLEKDNIESIQKIVDDLIFANNISMTKLKKEDIEFYLEMKKSMMFEKTE